jgi:hypothetical protein
MSEDYERMLGVVEAFSIVARQCPSAPVRSCAEQALEAAKRGKAGELRQQAYLVLTSMRGWRGDRAHQVLRSLQAFLDDTAPREAKTG